MAVGDAPATNLAIESDTQFTVETPPAGPSSAPIFFEVPAGMACPGTFYYDPAITSVAPGSSPTYGGTTITVTGQALSPNLLFSIGSGFATHVSCHGSTQCTMATPPAPEPGWANVVAVPQVGVGVQ
ncbi:MAG TPA: hypothetical protein DEP35_16170 [Deltaproteobacteria bacterium]|nr:hypothetical protein [Deltaproteobacteria bacterium]